MLYPFLLFLKDPATAKSYFKAAAQIKKINNANRIIFWLSYYHTGGAEKVHYRIAQVAKNIGLNPCFIFTEHSKDNTYKEKFEALGEVIDLGFRYKNKRVNDLLQKKLVQKMHTLRNTLVFTCNCWYFYDMLLSHTFGGLKIIDLIHVYDTETSLSYVNSYSRLGGYTSIFEKLAKRVFINSHALQQMAATYRKHKLAGTEKFELIYNAPFTHEDEPQKPVSKNCEGKTEVVFVARNVKEKRPWIAFEIAKQLTEKFPGQFIFKMIGAFEEYKNYASEDIRIITHLKDATEVAAHYKTAHLLMLVSEIEGFPMVIAEAMFYGVVPVSTSVNGIADLVEDGKNGFLVSPGKPGAGIIECVSEKISELHFHKTLLEQMGRKCFETATTYFSDATFSSAYTRLFQEVGKEQ